LGITQAVNSAGDGPGSEGVNPSIPLETPLIWYDFAYTYSSSAGDVSLHWDEVPGADGYKVWVFNGYDYESFDLGDMTYWISAGKGVWPTQQEINDGRYQLHHDKQGTDLSPNPRPVYTNAYNAGGLYGDYRNYENYWIRVSAYMGGKNSGSASITPQIPKHKFIDPADLPEQTIEPGVSEETLVIDGKDCIYRGFT